MQVSLISFKAKVQNLKTYGTLYKAGLKESLYLLTPIIRADVLKIKYEARYQFIKRIE